MSATSTAQVNSRNSRVCALLINKDRVFAMETSHRDIFDKVLSAARSGFPRNFVVAAKEALDEALAKGDTLSFRSAELHQLVTESLRVPALFRAQLH